MEKLSTIYQQRASVTEGQCGAGEAAVFLIPQAHILLTCRTSLDYITQVPLFSTVL